MSAGGPADGLRGVGGCPLVQAAEVGDAVGNAAADADPDVRDTEVFSEAQRRASTPERRLGYASAFSGAAVLANTLLGGSGMLGIPHALSRSGWLLGCVLVAMFGCASAFGSHLLHCSARRIGHAPSTFYTVCREVAPRWTWLIDGAVMVKCFGVGTSYLIIVGDLAPPALKFLLGHSSGIRRWHTVTVGFAAAGALSCLPDLTPLRYTATASVLITFWVVVLVLFFYCGVLEPCGSSGEDLPCCPPGGACPAPVTFSPVAPHGFVELGKALPVFIFGFTCQQNVFTICNEVRAPSKRRMDTIVVSAYTVSGAAFALAAVFGYATYGDGVTSDVLKGYPQVGIVQVTRLLFSLLAVFSYPLQAHPSRTSCLSLWSLVCGPPRTAGREVALAGSAGSSAGDRAWLSESQRFRVATVVGLFGSWLIAVIVTDLSAVLGVVGATGSTMVSYILPGLCYTQTFQDPHLKRSLAWLQLGAGCVIMPSCLALEFFK